MLFDGVCNLCNSSVQRIIRNDPHSTFRFASLQSDTGMMYRQKFAKKIRNTDSIILITPREKVFIKSTAVLLIAGKLSFPYPLLSFFLIIPAFIRNLVYDWIARNRYRWFGKRDQCMIPDEKILSRFI